MFRLEAHLRHSPHHSDIGTCKPTAEAMFNSYDMFKNANKPENSETWPANLIHPQSFRHTVKQNQEELEQNSRRLFLSERNLKHALVVIREASDHQNFLTTECKTLEHLRNHLQASHNDPKCRHVFFKAEHSRRPLDCSKAMFTSVMSWHQIMAPFVDLVLGFGNQPSGKEFHYTSFRHEASLDQNHSDIFSIPELGRSGLGIRHCFNLWSPEETVSPKSNTPSWSLRQAAAYHSFDLKSGRAVWITIKANDVLKKRIIGATDTCDALQVEALSELAGCFSAALTTHLIFFEWCGERWRKYNGSLEKDTSNILDKANNIPVHKVESLLDYDIETLIKTLQTTPETIASPTPERARTWQSARTAYSVPSSPTLGKFSRTFSGLSRITTTTMNSTGQSSRAVPPPMSPLLGSGPKSPVADSDTDDEEDDEEDRAQPQDAFQLLRNFGIKQLQSLNCIKADLHTSCLIMRLNAEVLNDVLNYYNELFDSFPDEIKTGCKYSFLEFSRRTTSIIRFLEKEQARTSALMLLLDDGKELFDKFLQLRHIEQNKLFTANAHQSTQHMQNLTVEMANSTLNMEQIATSTHTIAEKAKKETSSIHFITVVTLLFLPGTFIAVRLGLPPLPLIFNLLTCSQTIFGSGLFQWNDNDDPEGRIPIWKGDHFDLFMKWCGGLMALTFSIWILWAFVRPRCQARWRAYRQRQKPVDEEEGKTG
ncbi:hypothetical protein QBC38DRAFT_178135 [Podospora fimiseda]|uniref:CorA-like transporter domain-containing protein n=1 Tax=Podospora fimiseda TaxID=252190 RepID=A0AAN7H5K7_9PEZI|nr:hypothetical protein QBC38DRAFT_178135 [Podospora fimiseda]